MTVLDASAFLAYLLDEPGGDLVEDALAGHAVIGAVNLAEVLSKLSDAGVAPDEAMERITVLPVDLAVFDEPLAVEVARLRPATAAAGLSLGDRACLALAIVRGLPVLTAEAAWAGLVPRLEVRLIR